MIHRNGCNARVRVTGDAKDAGSISFALGKLKRIMNAEHVFRTIKEQREPNKRLRVKAKAKRAVFRRYQLIREAATAEM